MLNKRNIYFFQFNFKYGDNIFIPYSVGVIWSYAKSQKEIDEAYTNKGIIFLRDDPKQVVSSLDKPEICAFSSYVWNWEMNIEVAKQIKEKYPSCLIIFGGPQVPDDMEGFFDKYPFIDLTVHSEGEVTFAEILKTNISSSDTNIFEKYKHLTGISINHNHTTKNNNTKNKNSNSSNTTFVRRELIKNLDIIPSPYLTGVFDEVIKGPYKFQPIWETNRGCPYSCAYCDWGTSIITKIRNFSEERLLKEIQWFSDNKMAYLFGADANFGILNRDIMLATALAEKKKKTGYPEKYRVSYAKLSTDNIFKIAKILNNENMDKGISLSVQSMDKTTLENIKRTNMKVDSFSQFVYNYQKEGIPTFTELILALPGETYNSFKNGIDVLFDAGVHNSLVVYDCSILPNAPMNNKDYREKYKIKTTRLPIFLNHSIPGQDPVQEYEDIVTSTISMDEEAYKKTYIFSWAIQAFHILNLTQVIAIYFRKMHNLLYSDFYEELINYAQNNSESILGKELVFALEKLNRVLNGESKDIIIEEFSEVSWANDEAAYLHISKAFDDFFTQLKIFIKQLSTKFNLKIEENLIDELIEYQKAIIVKWDRLGTKELNLHYPFNHFYGSVMVNEKFEFKKGKYHISIKDNLNYNKDMEKYAREVLWYGRKGGKFIYQNITEKELS